MILKECEHPTVPSRALQNEADAISEENQPQYTSTSNLEHFWWFVGILMGQIVFWPVGMMGHWLFWMDEIVMFKLLMMGQVIFTWKNLIGQWLFFSKKIDWARTYFSKKIDWAGHFFSKKMDWAGTFFLKKIDWAGTFFAKKNDWAGTFFDLEKLRLPLSFSSKYCSLPKVYIQLIWENQRLIFTSELNFLIFASAKHERKLWEFILTSEN